MTDLQGGWARSWLQSRQIPFGLFGSSRLNRWVRRVILLVLIWLIISAAVAHKLTRRRQPPFAEPTPSVAWGEFESTRLKTRDGERIGAWYAAGAENAPSVLLLHGNGGQRRNSLTRAKIFAAEGCSVLLISLRAHGDSTGTINNIGLSARHDVVAAVEYLEKRRPGRPVVVLGTSMGAAAAIFASGELAHRVSGYILESPYEHLRRAVRNRTENALPPPFDWVAYQGMVLASNLILPELDAIAPVKAIEGIPADVPVLILAGRKDRLARPDEAQALYNRVRSHGQLLFFEKAGHVRFLESAPELYRRALLDFLSAIGPAGKASASATRGHSGSRPGLSLSPSGGEE